MSPNTMFPFNERPQFAITLRVLERAGTTFDLGQDALTRQFPSRRSCTHSPVRTGLGVEAAAADERSPGALSPAITR